MKNFNLHDIANASYRNQTTWEGAPTLSEDNRIYFITAVRGESWSLNVRNGANAYARTGAVDTQFYVPIVGESIVCSGTTEVSGFYITI